MKLKFKYENATSNGGPGENETEPTVQDFVLFHIARVYFKLASRRRYAEWRMWTAASRVEEMRRLQGKTPEAQQEEHAAEA